MPKRFPTPDPDIFTYEDGTHYIRMGDKERSLRTKEFAEARKRKKIALAKLENSGGASSRLKFGDIIDDYIAFRKKQLEQPSDIKLDRSNRAKRRRRTISKGTFKEIEDVWRLHLKSFWANRRVDCVVDDKYWTEYVDQSLVIDLANHKKVWRGVLKYCRQMNYIKYVPEIEVPPVDRRERRVLKPKEIKLLFKHANGSCLIFISMYLFMGMRRKEIMTLTWADVHFEEQYLVLRKSEVKTRKGRPLPLNAFVLILLKARSEEQRAKKITTPFVFPNRKNAKRHGDVSGLKTAFNTIMRKCGFESGYVTPHDLRATYEAYAHKSLDFTDTQREKFAGASIDVQKKTYVRFDAEDVRGLESVVQVEGLEEILLKKISVGKQRGVENREAIH